MIIKTLAVTNFGTNCYLVGDEQTKTGAVIDPGGDAEAILAAIAKAGLEIELVINTHGHVDHIGANADLLEATGATLVAHRLALPLLRDPARNLGAFMGRDLVSPTADRSVEEGDTLDIGALSLTVLHTPGHTPGGISLYLAKEEVVFTGDALFQGSIGRTDFPGGNHDLLIQSIREKLLALPEDTRVYPGHGPTTTIGRERRTNPWIQI
jgi:glyoxylase-like metal-dependent hydrolase (beta-lactamase superfamily II)